MLGFVFRYSGDFSVRAGDRLKMNGRKNIINVEYVATDFALQIIFDVLW
jgi:hypothetical protein